MKTTILILSLCLAHFASAATFNSDGTPASILEKLALCNSAGGDTITLPSGTITWTTGLTVTAALTKPVTLQGTWNGSAGTTIVGNQSSGLLINWIVADGNNTGPVELTRWTGLYLKKGTGQGTIRITGTNNTGSRFRFDHSVFEHGGGENWMVNWVGLWDHVTCIRKGTGTFLRPSHANWNGGTYGNKSWTDPLVWNSDQWQYFEDCIFYGDGSHNSVNTNDPVVDLTSGARCIWRHCQIYGQGLKAHGNDTGNSIPIQGIRAPVANGKFCNEFFSVTSGQMSDYRSGQEIAYGNRAMEAGSTTQGGFPLKTYRQWNCTYGFGGSDGNPNNKGGSFDNNDQIDTNTPRAHFSGHALSNSGTTPTGRFNHFRVTVRTGTSGGSSPAWTADQWVPTNATYYVINKSREDSLGGECSGGALPGWWSGSIGESGPDWIDFEATDQFAVTTNKCSFTAGDLLEIRKINMLMDQVGVHGGALFSGTQPNAVKPYADGQLDQVVYPVYNWDNYVWNTTTSRIGNRINASNFGLRSAREDTHFINLSGSSTSHDPAGVDNHNASAWAGSTPPPCTGFDGSGNPTPTGCFTEYTYPHPMQGATTGPQITSANGTTFVGGAGSQTFQVTTSGFSGTPTIAISSWTPSTPSNISFGTPNCTAGQFCGSASGNNPGEDFNTTITATYSPASQTATQVFTMHIGQPPNSPPAWPGGSFTATPTTGNEPLDVTLSGNPTDDNGVVKVEFYRNGVLINTDTSAPYSFVDADQAAGTYSYTAKAYDGGTPQLSTTSSAVSVTANTPPNPGAPSAAPITIRP